jgi:hypothetical protein
MDFDRLHLSYGIYCDCVILCRGKIASHALIDADGNCEVYSVMDYVRLYLPYTGIQRTG